jgi:hypothetical protein
MEEYSMNVKDSVTIKKQPLANKTPVLSTRARRYATIISLLFAKQGITGNLSTAHRGAHHLSLGVRLNDPTQLDRALSLAEPLALHSGTRAVLAQRDNALVVYLFELNQGYWESYTRADLPTLQAVGLAEQRRPVDFDFNDAPHALVAGTTNSGKSETIKSVLVSMLTTDTPDALRLGIIDPDGDYTDFYSVAHLALPVAHEPGQFADVLTWFVGELKQRKENNQRDAQRLVLVIDEAHEVLHGQNLTLCQQLAQGRKYRIHLVIVTQKPLHGDMPKILDNLDNRFVGRVVDAKVSATVTGQAGLEAHKLTGAGDFLHVTGATVQRFQVAQATRADIDALPRADVQPVKVVSSDLIELPPDLPERTPGRPQLIVNPEYAAWYFYHNPDKISRAMAKEVLGLSRDNHELHREFTQRFIMAYLQLRQAKAIGA